MRQLEFSMKLIVLIPHYNDPKALEQTLLSIDESFDVDVLVVDDGSTQKPDRDKLSQLYQNGKLFFEDLEENSGIGIALNQGLERISKMDYELIARLDCGDYNKKNKYKKQLDFLKANPDVKLVGTWADMVDEEGKLLFVLEHPTTDADIKRQMYKNNMFIHPTVVFYKEILNTVGFYPEKYRRAAQDYALFFKVSKNFKVANLPESLLTYRMDDNSISTSKRKLQVKHRINIIMDNFYLGFYPVYGILRNSILYFMSRDTTTKLKQLLRKAN